MARINHSQAMKISQEVSRARNIAKRGAGATDHSLKVQEALRAYIDEEAPKSKKKVLEYLYNRMRTEGDDFEKITGMGEYNELLVGIHLGLFDDLEDIEGYDVFDSIKHEEAGDFTFSDSGTGGRVDLQAKGMDASFRIPKATKLVLNNKGRVLKVKTLDSFARNYIKSSPTDIRFGLPIFRSANVGFFDLGSETFLKLIKHYPGVFSFSLNKSAKAFQKYAILFEKTTETLVKELLLMTDAQLRAQSELGRIIKVRFTKDLDMLKARIRLKIENKRKEAWYRWGTVRLTEYNSARIAKEINPLINTGIMYGDNHAPFYQLLGKLYSSTSLAALRKDYLRKTSTLANKLPNAYYYNEYHNIRY